MKCSFDRRTVEGWTGLAGLGWCCRRPLCRMRRVHQERAQPVHACTDLQAMACDGYWCAEILSHLPS